MIDEPTDDVAEDGISRRDEFIKKYESLKSEYGIWFEMMSIDCEKAEAWFRSSEGWDIVELESE